LWAYLGPRSFGFVDMGAAVATGSSALHVQARRLRSRAASIRREAANQRRRSEELGDELAEILLDAGGRAFGDQGKAFVLRLGRVRPMVRFARRDLRRWLEAAGLPAEVVGEIELACSEACANAVEHPKEARRQLFEIEAQLDHGEMELRVRDYGSWNDPRPSELRGRGLSMIGELMDAVGIEHRPDGTEIFMRRSIV
jgi:anti-sigma regulatory factor (Ser/Thr protein kinase)